MVILINWVLGVCFGSGLGVREGNLSNVDNFGSERVVWELRDVVKVVDNIGAVRSMLY